jgi:hypothetical protein
LNPKGVDTAEFEHPAAMSVLEGGRVYARPLRIEKAVSEEIDVFG